jgi:hypothetical protein
MVCDGGDDVGVIGWRRGAGGGGGGVGARVGINLWRFGLRVGL